MKTLFEAARELDDSCYEVWKMINSTWCFPKKRRMLHQELDKIREIALELRLRKIDEKQA